jgi:hypothetical protein
MQREDLEVHLTNPRGHQSNGKRVYSDVSKNEYQSVICPHASVREFGIA